MSEQTDRTDRELAQLAVAGMVPCGDYEKLCGALDELIIRWRERATRGSDRWIAAHRGCIADVQAILRNFR